MDGKLMPNIYLCYDWLACQYYTIKNRLSEIKWIERKLLVLIRIPTTVAYYIYESDQLFDHLNIGLIEWRNHYRLYIFIFSISVEKHNINRTATHSNNASSVHLAYG